MKKKKILYTGYSSNMGGIERFLINVCKNLDKNKFEVYILSFDGKNLYFQKELEQIGIRFLNITSRTKNYQKYVKDLKKIYGEYDFDVIHFNIMNFSCFERIILAKKYSQARLILHSHSASIQKVYRKTRFLDKVGRFFTRNIEYEKLACGQEAGEWLFDKKEFLVLNNGIDVQEFQFNQNNRNEIRDEFNIKDNETVMGVIAKLEEQKNPRFLMDIFFEYQKLNSDSKLLLVGEGSLREELEEKARRLEIQDKVLFLGRRDDTEKIYSAMDIFVMPSWFEGFSIAIVEAQVNGLKCYTSTNVARESNIIGNVEFLSLEEAPKDWAQKIFEADNGRDEKAMDKIPDKFKIEETVKSLSKIYEEK